MRDNAGGNCKTNKGSLMSRAGWQLTALRLVRTWQVSASA